MAKQGTKSKTDGSLPLETVAETAENLNVSERTVWRLIKSGELRIVRFAGVVRVRPEDRKTFIKEHLS